MLLDIVSPPVSFVLNMYSSKQRRELYSERLYSESDEGAFLWVKGGVETEWRASLSFCVCDVVH